jgi:tetratricopeptide (TPR) repeat protein
MMNWRNWLFIFLIVPAGLARAQFEDGEGDINDADLDEPAASAPARTEVSKEDLKALQEAKTRKNEEALIRAASRILGVDSKHVVALNTLALFYYEQGKLGLAKIILSRALKDHADVAALHNNLGIIYLAENKQRLAIGEFKKALDLESSQRIAAANLGSIFLEYRDYERAMRPLEAGYRATRSELKSGTPYAVEVANNYAVALSGLGKFDDAKEIYGEIAAGSARHPTVLLNYAILLIEKMKNYKEGGKLLSRIKFAVDDGKALRKVEELEAKMRATEEK